MERSVAWGNKNFEYRKIYFQWCVADARMQQAIARRRTCNSQAGMSCTAEPEVQQPSRSKSVAKKVEADQALHRRVLESLQESPSLITDDIAFDGSLCNTLWLDRLTV